MGISIAHRRPHVTGQRPAHAPAGAETGRTASLRFHDLRHTFATMALQNGVDVKTVSSMLGHYSAGFTLDTYAHVTTDAQLKAAKPWGISSPVRSDGFRYPLPLGSAFMKKQKNPRNQTISRTPVESWTPSGTARELLKQVRSDAAEQGSDLPRQAEERAALRAQEIAQEAEAESQRQREQAEQHFG